MSCGAAVLTHRYSFDIDANDLIGGANGVLYGNTYLTNGAAVFDGTNSGVQLPNDLFTNYDSIGFEIWFVDEAASDANARLYMFSGPQGAINFITLAPSRLALSYAQGSYAAGTSLASVYIPLPVVGRTNHFVWTQDAALHAARIYINGISVAERTNFLLTPALVGSTTNNWIGAAGTGTAMFKGRVLDFRTYQGVLSSLEVALLHAAGPDQTLPVPGALQGVRLLELPPTAPGALLRPAVFADFANLTNVNIAGQPDLIIVKEAVDQHGKD